VGQIVHEPGSQGRWYFLLKMIGVTVVRRENADAFFANFSSNQAAENCLVEEELVLKIGAKPLLESIVVDCSREQLHPTFAKTKVKPDAETMCVEIRVKRTRIHE